MNALIDAAIQRRRTTLSIMAFLCVWGIWSRLEIPVEADPRIEVPFFVVRIVHEGISPEDAERLLVMPAEKELRTIEGVKEINGYAAEGLATLSVEFDAEYDLDQAGIDVREAIDRAKAEMPSTAEEPVVLEQNTDDFPSIEVNLTGENVPERVLYNAAIMLKDDLESLPEVLEVQMRGQREELLEAVVDPARMESYGIGLAQVLDSVAANNRLIPAGAVDTGSGRFSVKVPSIIEEAKDLYDLPVLTDGATTVTLSQIADIRRTFKDRTGFARVNGRPTISLGVIKRSTANVVDTNEKVRALVDARRASLPASVDLFYTQDQAPFAQQQVRELEGNILTALVLVMIVVVAAMGVVTGLIVGFAIPVSFLFGLIFVNLQGFTFNFMVMFGMLLGLGMLIDGAIVVSEYADRKMSEGFDRRGAYALAAKRMFWPVVASTATTLAAFLPLLLWPGVSGKFMRFLPMTVFTVLGGSLLYALFFGPTIGAWLGRPPRRSEKELAELRELEDGDPTRLRNLTGLYARLLRVATRFAGTTFLLTLASLFGSFWLYGEYGRGMTFFTDTDPQFAAIDVKARGNLSADEVLDIVVDVERRVLGIPGIESLNTSTMLPGAGGFRGSGDRVGRMFLEFHEQPDREMTGLEILEEIRKRTGNIAGITVEARKLEQGPPVGKEIQIQLTSRERSLLEPAAARIAAYLESLPGLRDVEDTRSLPGIEWKLEVDRARAAELGASVSVVGGVVQMLTGGIKVGEYRPDDAEDEVDIRVRFPESERGLDAFDRLRVATASGQVPISSFVRQVPSPRVDTTQRQDGIPVEFVRSDVLDGVLASDKVKEIEAWLAEQDFDPRIAIRFKGANEEQVKAMQFVAVAFLMSLLLMFILLVAQFNSFYQTLLILFAVVMSTAGVLIGLVITGDPFSAIMTGIGIVALAGIVVNNNIVLIDTYNHLSREHRELDYIELIVRTGAQRLRPVLLTTFTTIFGLLPLASHLSVDFISRDIVYGGQVSTFWVPLSRSIVFGLTFATLLTLVATPALLALPHKLRASLGRLRARQAARRNGDTPAALDPATGTSA